jgi:predicted XRE-type DNA-binding protein
MEILSFEMGTKTKLGKIIDKYDLSQKELAEFVDVTPASVNRWCNVVNGKVTQFEYKLIPDILNFFSSKGVNLHPNDFLDLEQYGVEKSKISVRGSIQNNLNKDEFHQKNEIHLYPEPKLYNPPFNLPGEIFIIEERKNTNHLLLHLVDNSIKYEPDDNRIIDLPGIITFINDLYKKPILAEKLTRYNEKLTDVGQFGHTTPSSSLVQPHFELNEIAYIQLLKGVLYSK